MRRLEQRVAGHIDPTARRIVVFLPNWVGDVVMATPTLRALRRYFAEAHIACVLRWYVRPIVDASPWHDRLLIARRPPREGSARRSGSLVRRLRRGRFDLAVLLTNSFRSGLTVRLAAVPRRIGYARQWRGPLLTDRLQPLRHHGRYTPVSAVDYYLAVAQRLGADIADARPQLHTRPTDDRRAEALLARVAGQGPVVMLNPGAATKGQAKLWPAERFAAVADYLVDHHGATVLVNGSPAERPQLEAVRAAARRDLVILADHGSDLRLLKSLCRRCDLMVSNDTGGRHVAVAMGVPTVSLFGPTDPQWARYDVPHETIIRSAEDDCAMTGIDVSTVIDAAERAMAATAKGSGPT
jgi:heptosyltransferase-2